MKKIFNLSIGALVVFLFTLQVSISSCTKDKTLYDTVTVTKRDTIFQIKHDTLTIKDTVLTAQILSANPWMIQEIRGVLGSAIYYYLRGGSNNTQSFDNEYITFNADKTGAYVENNGNQHTLTWDFANADHTKIFMTIQLVPYVTDITWENIVYKNASIRFDQYYTQGGVNEHSQNIRIPKK